jgi:hypothetical protein
LRYFILLQVKLHNITKMRKTFTLTAIIFGIIIAFSLASFKEPVPKLYSKRQSFHKPEYSGGIIGYSVAGCTCHGASSTAASVSLSGLPVSPISGVTYTVTATVTGPNPGAGINISATSGTLSNPSSSAQLISGEITHNGTQTLSGGSVDFSFDWTPNVAGTSTINIAANNVDQTGGTGNDFWLQRAFIFNIQTLPIKLISFNGIHENGSKNTLIWKVESETNFKHYELQFSCDGINFSTVQTIQPQQGSALKTYQAQHSPVSCNDLKNYYRLKIVNLDNTAEYSQVVALTKHAKYTKPTLFPNPSIGSGNKVRILGNLTNLVEIKIASSSGQVLKTYNGNLNFVLNELTLPSKMLAGKYIVQLIYKDKRQEALPFVVQ